MFQLACRQCSPVLTGAHVGYHEFDELFLSTAAVFRELPTVFSNCWRHHCAAVYPIVERPVFGWDVARALHYCHSQGVLYCDLRPQTVLVDENGNSKVSNNRFHSLIVLPNLVQREAFYRMIDGTVACSVAVWSAEQVCSRV